MRTIATLFIIVLSQLIFAQTDYRSESNQYYWKNKKPIDGYWQQDVAYQIKANINDSNDVIEGEEVLTYWNNSPDELSFVYFHLYQNAFQPGSYTDNLHRNNDFPIKYGKYEKKGLGTQILALKANNIDLKTEEDNTVLKVFLTEPLKPGSSVKFTISFKTYFDNGGTIRRRMKLFNAYGYKHYDGVHWYPRISVYDRKLGWDTDQHLGKEFYGDYGTFEVELTFPSHFIVEATGILTNEKEVLPDDLKSKLDLKNFKDKPLEQAPSVIIPADGSKKTWKYVAQNVHDFAFTADPTYRIGETSWNGIKCVAVAQEPHAAKWQNAAEYAAKIIQINSEDFGMYAYPKMVVADARDGMEYPMLTLDGGLDPDYRSLLVHEISHNWFFGMIGSNETYRAALDEGFTQFLTAWTYAKIDGPIEIKSKPKSSYIQKYLKSNSIINTRAYNAYILDAAKGDETTLNTHSDDFNGALRHGGGYSQVYYKTATMLYNLQYVLGDSLFLKAIQHYFDQWKMCHPYMEDFRSSIIQYTKVDLNWFFDQWLETSKTIDYSVKRVKKIKEGEYRIAFKRKGRMQMPIDFQVISKDSSKYNYYIPNTWFEKNTTATVLPRWIGWNKVKPFYTAVVKVPGGISDVVIDPTHRLADVNMLNNSLKFPMITSFDSRVYNSVDWTKYELFVRPDVWYNGYDGIKAGIHLNGNYLNLFHVFDLNIWLNTGLAQRDIPLEAFKNKYENLSFRFNYKTSLNKCIKNSFLSTSFKILDGLNSYSARFEKLSNSQKNKVYVQLKSMIRNRTDDVYYLLSPQEWIPKKLNNTITLGVEHDYSYKRGSGNINLWLRSSTLTNDYDYSNISLQVINKNDLGRINLNTRTFVQYGLGNNWAKESQLFAAGANPEELMDNKYTRSIGFFPTSWAGYGASINHFQAGGGLNLRGYAGYLMPELDKNGNIRYTYRGTSGAAINAELEFQELVKIKPRFLKNTFKLSTYLFGDAGVINNNLPGENLSFAALRADAGVGAALTIQHWGPLQMVKPLTIRFDVPLFLNKIPAVELDHVAFRWILGISRSF